MSYFVTARYKLIVCSNRTLALPIAGALTSSRHYKGSKTCQRNNRSFYKVSALAGVDVSFTVSVTAVGLSAKFFFLWTTYT